MSETSEVRRRSTTLSRPALIPLSNHSHDRERADYRSIRIDAPDKEEQCISASSAARMSTGVVHSDPLRTGDRG